MARWRQLILDNPILIKHLRSRLRRPQFVPAAAITLVLCLLIAWYGASTGGFQTGWVHSLTLALQAVLLVIMGASQVASAVGGVRESSILDFHRISPLPPLVTTLGFFLGAPCREYLLYVLTLPLSLLCVAYGWPGFGELVQEQLALLLVAWTVQAVALLGALISARPKVGVSAPLIVIFLLLFNGVGSFVTGTRGGPDTTLSFFGVDLPWLAFLAVQLGTALVFLLIASTRKMRSERAHTLSKPQALVFLGCLATLLLGGLWGTYRYEGMLVVALYLLVGFGLLTAMTITPSAGEFLRGQRRAEHEQRPYLGPLDELSLNRIALAGLGLIVLLGGTLIWTVISDRLGPIQGPVLASFPERLSSQGRPGLAIALGVLTVLSFGLAYQYFQLHDPRRAGTLMGLFLFLAWVVPILAGLILQATQPDGPLGVGLIAASPLAGLAITAGALVIVDLALPLVVAIAMALLLTFVFYHLISVERRRLLRGVRARPVGSAAPRPDPLGGG